MRIRTVMPYPNLTTVHSVPGHSQVWVRHYGPQAGPGLFHVGVPTCRTCLHGGPELWWLLPRNCFNIVSLRLTRMGISRTNLKEPAAGSPLGVVL